MENIPVLAPGRLLLLTLPQTLNQEITHQLIARLCLTAPVHVLEGGKAFAAFYLARLIRRQTAQLEEALGRITLARAFTCYQVLALLADNPATDSPCFVLNFLTTFYDESVTHSESERLLHLASEHLLRLRERAPVVVSVSPPPKKYAACVGLVSILKAVADEILYPEPVQHPILQLHLFQ